MKKIVLFSAVFLIGLSSCKKDEPEPQEQKPANGVNIEFRNVVGSEDLEFGKEYLSPSGDTFTVSKFNYFISNITFIRGDGTEYKQPESYFVVRHPQENVISISDVPEGTYTRLRLLIGVDSARNNSGAQTGGLDLAKNGDMFWSWNTGYIFMKLEGKSPRSDAANNALTYHIGGFKGETKTQREVTIQLGSTPLTVNDKVTALKLKADVNEIFTNPHSIDFSTFNFQMQPGEGARNLADNYSNMLSLESVQN